MAAGIKVTLAADGEKKFKKAISDTEKSIKTLNTRLTLATAEFKKDGDAQKYMQDKSEALGKEMELQRSIVQSLEGALKDTADKYGENSIQAEHWEGELNKAKATLINMESELENNNQGLDKNGRAYSNTADTATRFGEAVSEAIKSANQFDFRGVDQAITNLQSRLKSAATAIVQFSKKSWQLVADSSTWADDMITLATQMNVPLQELQGWDYAARFVDTDVSAIAKAMAKLANPTKTVTDELKNVGVSITDASGQLRNKEDVFWDTIGVLNRMSDEAQKDALAQEVFGKSFSQLLPLINAGREEWEKYVNEAKDTGVILSDDQMSNLGSFNDSLQSIDASWQALQHNISAEIAPGMQTIADAFHTLVTDFNTWAQSKEGKEALGNLSDSISATVKSLTEHVDFPSLVDTATGALSGLGDVLGKITNDPSGIIGATGAALATYAGLTISKDVLSLIKLFTEAKESSLLSDTGAALGKAGSVLGPLALKALPGAAVAAGVWALSNALDDLAKERDWGWTKELDNLSAGISPEGVAAIKAGIQAGITQGITAAQTAEEISTAIKTQWEEGLKLFEGQITADSTGGKAFSQGEMSILENWVETALGEDVKQATEKAHGMWQSVYDAAVGKGFTPEEATTQADSLLKDNPLIQTVNELEKTKAELDTAMEQLYKAGNNATESEIQKVRDLMGQVRELQEQLGILQNDTAQFAKNSYDLTVQGKGTATTMGAGIAYVNETAARKTEEAQKALTQSEQDYVQAMTEAAGDTTKEAEALAAYTKQQEAANKALEEAPIEKARMLADLVNGYGASLQGSDQFVRTMETIADLTRVIRDMNEGEAVTFDERGIANYSESLQAAIQKGLIDESTADAGTYFLLEEVNDKLEQAMRDMNSQLPAMSGLTDYMQAVVEETDIDDIDLSSLTGPLAAALHAQMLIAAAGEDGVITVDELMEAIDSKRWQEIGSAVPEGAAEGVSANADAPKIAIKKMDADMEQAMREDWEVNSPSRLARDIASYIPEGAKLGIEKTAPTAVAAALTAGNQISAAFAQGIEAGISRVQSAVSRMVAAASVSPAGAWSGQPGSYTYTSSNRNSSLYIGTYNQNTTADVESIISMIDDRRASVSAGYGG